MALRQLLVQLFGLTERIKLGAVGGVDYQVMMVLASGLASLGLLEDSTAVVIGAMLVTGNRAADWPEDLRREAMER